MVEEIEISLLVGHPDNCNFMDKDTIRKLRKHIESTGIYEPLIIRPHPVEKGKFQVINGHNRLRVLQALVEIVRFYLSQCAPNSTEMHCKQ